MSETMSGEERPGLRARRAESRRRARADLLFLAGLVSGGPIVSFGEAFLVGLLLILAGAVASAVQRWSTADAPGSVGLGLAAVAVVTALLMDPASSVEDPLESGDAAVAAREAYVSALAYRLQGVGTVEARGLNATVVWFFLTDEGGDGARECGTVPAPEVRRHLGEMGVSRIVVSDRSAAGSLCSFAP